MTLRPLLLSLLVLGACHAADKPATPAATGTRTITAATLDSLPAAAVADGGLLCLADGRSACPVGFASANWLHDGKFVTWEPKRLVQIWTPGKTDPQLLGELGEGEGKYEFVVGVAAAGKGYVVLNASGMRALRYNTRGDVESSWPFPPVTISHATGYSGDVPFYQRIGETAPDSAAEFEIREVDTPGDTVGRTVLKTPLRWLRLRDQRPVAAVPLFPVLPSFAIAPDSDVVWSRGDIFAIERRSPAGALRWSIQSDVTGPPVTPDEIAQARSSLPPDADKAQRAKFDSAVAATSKFHPALDALLLAPDQQLLAVGMTSTSQDSVRHIVIDRTGIPVARVSLPRRTRVVLFAGDSILVQRPGANAEPEMRWLILHRAASR